MTTNELSKEQIEELIDGFADDQELECPFRNGQSRKYDRTKLLELSERLRTWADKVEKRGKFATLPEFYTAEGLTRDRWEKMLLFFAPLRSAAEYAKARLSKVIGTNSRNSSTYLWGYCPDYRESLKDLTATIERIKQELATNAGSHEALDNLATLIETLRHNKTEGDE
jgi:hypothetical protein